MIYKKEANFPYPILTNNSNSYEDASFTLDIELQEDNNNYRFYIDYVISSEFINDLVENDDAELIFIIQSKDNKFFNLDKSNKYVDISKSRISLSKRTSIQMMIKSKREISFKTNNDLNDFYKSIEEELVVPKNSVLGFSNVVIFDGSIKKPLQLFEKKLNTGLKSDVNIELGAETIVINYRSEDLQFSYSPISNTLNNHYVYMGLQKALYRFLRNNSNDGGETSYINEIDVPTNGLDLKIYNLLKTKLIDEVSIDNVDEVIYRISDKILEKHACAIKGLYQNEN